MLGITGMFCFKTGDTSSVVWGFFVAVQYLHTSCCCCDLSVSQTARDCAFNTDKCRALHSAAEIIPPVWSGRLLEQRGAGGDPAQPRGHRPGPPAPGSLVSD